MTARLCEPDRTSLPDVLIDVRCLQDPNFAGRGIGRHATALLEGARASPTIAAGARLIGLQDPSLPPMTDRCRAALDDLRSTAYTGALTQPVWFVQLSPMTHDPLFVARLLHHAAPLTATIVYDFIPLDEPESYLADPRMRLDYHVALGWLSRYDLFAPISQASASRLRELTAAGNEDIAVTGAPLDPIFEPSAAAAAPGSRSHVLVIGGGDPRKNVECAIRGHALCASMQAAAIPLVVTGDYTPHQCDLMRDCARAAGGNPALIRVPGRVGDAALVSLYRDAIGVVVPSLAEGFSLPVIEAMAAGVPAVASRIPPHAELVAMDALLFPPNAPAQLSDILARLLTDDGLRHSVIAGQQKIWPRYRAAQVARRFWAALEARAQTHSGLPPASVVRGRRPRVALLTPLPPDRSGVADFSAASCAALGDRADLHVFTATLSAARPPGAVSVQPLCALPLLSADFDRVISVMGNSEFHLEIHRLLTRYGGACIAHDSRMLGFYCSMYGMTRACEVARRELGRPVTQTELVTWLEDESTLPASLLDEIAQAAQPLFMHSTAVIENVRLTLRSPAVHLPFPIYRPWSDDALQQSARADARTRLGLPPDAIVIASFGFLHWTKAPVDCIWALETLRSWGIPATLHFVGSANMNVAMLRALAREIGVGHCVRFSDEYLDESAYRDYLLAADLGLQLRILNNGAVSGALQDCIGAGLATVANRDLAMSVDAPDYVRCVPDRLSPVLIAEALAELVADGAHTHRHDTARRAYAASHSFDRYAALICDALGLEVDGRS
jgi:glycosyltransferase involved in cell wall biosynthesis